MSVGSGYKEPKNELFFSLPAGKPPFLGIVYESLDVSTLPKEFLSDEAKELFIYYTNNKINIRVQLSDGIVVRFYSQLIYDRTQLLLWLDDAKNAKSIVFGHLWKKDPKPEMIKEPKTQKPYYFTVRRLFLIDFKDELAIRIVR